MALVDLWNADPDQLREKHVAQIIAFAGDGVLTDSGTASAEFRKYLTQIPSRWLKRYAEECLSRKFDNSGLALQDIVNEIGARLDLSVMHGRYRGSAGHIGHDGLWRLPDDHHIVVEVKTTDAYRIDLGRVAGYHRSLFENDVIDEQASSILIVVGRQDTGDLEAQIRGSRYAWDVRLMSVDSLIRLMQLKEDVEDPATVQRIHQILVPREFTRLDGIVDILFSTAEDLKQEDQIGEAEQSAATPDRKPKFTPVAFHDECVATIEGVLERSLIKRSRASFSSPDGDLRLVCSVSKEHLSGKGPSYWFGFRPHQAEFVGKTSNGYVAFGCGSPNQLLLIPAPEFLALLDGLNKTENDDQFYWHVTIFKEDDRLLLHRKGGEDGVDLTRYLVSHTIHRKR